MNPSTTDDNPQGGPSKEKPHIGRREIGSFLLLLALNWTFVLLFYGSAARARAHRAPIVETASRGRLPQRKNSSETCFHFGMLSSVCSGVKNCTRKPPSFGFKVGSSAGISGCDGR